MRALLFLILLAPLAQARERCRTPDRDGNCTAVPFFSFAPASGAGLPVGGPYTSTRGVALTCTRASASSCPTPWDTEATLVDLSDNECCITRVGPGGYPALGRYGAYTERLIRTSEFDNAAWTSQNYPAGAPPGAPIVTTDAAVSPNGTSTAEQVVFAATGDGQISALYSLVVTSNASAPAMCSVYARVPSGTGVTDLCSYSGSVYVCTSMALTTSWRRYEASATGGGSTTRMCKIGNETLENGGISRSQVTVYLWRGNLTETDRLMPSADAASAAVNVAATAAQFAGQDLSRMETQGCVAVTYSPTGVAAATVGDGLFFLGANGRVLYRTTDAAVKAYDGTNTPSHAVTWAANTPVRLANRWSGTTSTLYNITAGTSTAGTYDGTWGFGATSTIDVGYTATSTTPEGWLYNLQADPNPQRCR